MVALAGFTDADPFVISLPCSLLGNSLRYYVFHDDCEMVDDGIRRRGHFRSTLTSWLGLFLLFTAWRFELMI